MLTSHCQPRHPCPPGITRGVLHAKRPSLNLATPPEVNCSNHQMLTSHYQPRHPCPPGITPTTPGLPMGGLSPPLPSRDYPRSSTRETPQSQPRHPPEVNCSDSCFQQRFCVRPRLLPEFLARPLRETRFPDLNVTVLSPTNACMPESKNLDGKPRILGV